MADCLLFLQPLTTSPSPFIMASKPILATSAGSSFFSWHRLVQAGVDFLLVRDVAPIKPVLQHQVKRAARETLAAGKLSVGSLPSLAHDAGPLELCLQQRDRAKGQTLRYQTLFAADLQLDPGDGILPCTTVTELIDCVTSTAVPLSAATCAGVAPACRPGLLN